MSGLAKYLVSQGKSVSGSDVRANDALYELKALGIPISIGHDVSAVQGVDAVVRSSAVSDDDPEILEARRLGIPVFSRGQLLGAITNNFVDLIAVSGTHGKSTVTAMTASALIGAGVQPFVHVGAQGVDQGDVTSDVAVVEACEYKGNFLHLNPSVGVILNVESDHPDCYSDESALLSAFSQFSSRIREGGTLIKPAGLSLPDQPAKVISVGTDVRAEDVVQSAKGYSFVPVVDGRRWQRVCLGLSGYFNVTNALFAIAAASCVGASKEGIVRGLSQYRGLKKRFEHVGRLNGADVIVDYAHHPTAIRAVLATARQMTKGHLTVVFQPHTYSRTKALFDEFVSSLLDANAVIIAREYPARETPDMGKSAFDLYNALVAKGVRTRYVTSAVEACEVARRYAYSGDLVLVLGAGNVGDEFVNYL